MNREQAKDRIHKYVGNGLSEAMRTIDKIYDDFESRTCENCKYFSQTSQSCFKIKEAGYNLQQGKDFGCIKFERRD